MVIAHFRLTLSAPARSILRLVQIAEYAHLRVVAPDGEAQVSRDLADVLAAAFPGMAAESAYAELFGDRPPGWEVRAGRGTQVTIETDELGAELTTLIRAISIAAPEALASNMHYAPKAPSALGDGHLRDLN